MGDLTRPAAEPSATARLVAAYRVGFERTEVPYGDVAAADALERDVAAGTELRSDPRMVRYLRGRTAFFDRAVVRAIERGIGQFVVVGAGYDARSLRYGDGLARWFEVDREPTQADKLARLARLGIDAGAVAFLAADLADGGLADALVAAGFEPDAPALMYAEGLLAYLSEPVVDRLFGELRRLAAPGTRLAISLRVRPSGQAAEEFRNAVVAAGEPVLGTLDADGLPAALQQRRWSQVELSERARAAGFAVATPVWAPAPDQAATLGVIGSYLDTTFGRRGTSGLAACVSAAQSVQVNRTRELDVGVFELALPEGGRWTARVFPATRTVQQVRGDAELLRALERADFPAERLAPVHDPVCVLEGQGVLLTTFAVGRAGPAGPADFERYGRLLGELHQLDLGLRRPGGGWHHLVADGTAADEARTAARLLQAAGSRVSAPERPGYVTLLDALDRVHFPEPLPTALIHPDFVPQNILCDGDTLTVIDWGGAGIAPRIVALGVFLWSAAQAGTATVRAAVAGYLTACPIEQAELAALPAAIDLRPLTLTAWTFVTGRTPLHVAIAEWREHQRSNARAVQLVREVLAGHGTDLN